MTSEAIDAVGEALEPLVAPAGSRREQVLLDELVPHAGPLLRALVGEVDRDVGAVDRERAAAGLPDHARGEARVAGVGGDVLRRVGGVQLARGVDVLVPGGRARRCRTGRRRPCCRTAPWGPESCGRPTSLPSTFTLPHVDALYWSSSSSRPYWLRSTSESDEGELRHGVVLDLHDVGRARAGLDRVLQLRVLLGVRAGVHQLDVDVRVRLLERGDLRLGARRPAPVGELAAGLERGVEVVGAAGCRRCRLPVEHAASAPTARAAVAATARVRRTAVRAMVM